MTVTRRRNREKPPPVPSDSQVWALSAPAATYITIPMERSPQSRGRQRTDTTGGIE